MAKTSKAKTVVQADASSSADTGALLASIVRTVTPVIVGALLTALLKLGVQIDAGTATTVVNGIIMALYYAVARYLETHASAEWGWLLGLAKAPAYSPKAPVSPDTDEVLETRVVPDPQDVDGAVDKPNESLIHDGEEPPDDAPGVVVASSSPLPPSTNFGPQDGEPDTGLTAEVLVSQPKPAKKPAAKKAPAKKAAATPIKTTPLARPARAPRKKAE